MSIGLTLEDCLNGIKVIDLSTALAGPSATSRLADLGAQVIAIESPGGDRIRHSLPGCAGLVTAGKKYISVDLNQPQGLEIVRQLVATADVFVHSTSQAGLERKGLGYDALTALNPRLVYVNLVGYPEESGALKKRGAIDFVVQAESGIMAANADATGPRWLPFFLVDSAAGTELAYAVLAALLRRERGGTGTRVEVSMWDAAVALLGPKVSHAHAPMQDGATDPFATMPGELFQSSDGWIAVATHVDAWFEAFCNALDRGDLCRDDRFRSNDARREHHDALVAQLAPEIARRSTAQLEAQLAKPGVVFGVVQDVAAVARRVAHHAAAAGEGSESCLARLTSSARFPPIGKDVHEVLGEIGLPAEEIDALIATGALARDPP